MNSAGSILLDTPEMIVEDQPTFKVDLRPKGMTVTRGFFIFFFLLFSGALAYGLYTLIQNAAFTSIHNYYALFFIGGSLLLFIYLFAICYSLTFERQRIEIAGENLYIIKKRLLLPDVRKKIILEDIESVFSEKLKFNFMNIWYAFLFHHSYSENDLENFLVPHIRTKGNKIAFLEFASDQNKSWLIKTLESMIRK